MKVGQQDLDVDRYHPLPFMIQWSNVNYMMHSIDTIILLLYPFSDSIDFMITVKYHIIE